MGKVWTASDVDEDIAELALEVDVGENVWTAFDINVAVAELVAEAWDNDLSEADLNPIFL